MFNDMPTFRKAMNAINKNAQIGSGDYRTVYRTRGKWAYKVDMVTGGQLGTNSYEYATYLEYIEKPLPDGVKIPEMHLLEGNILATEYIKGMHPLNWECYRSDHTDDLCPGKENCWAEKVKGIPISDLHGGNVLITDDGTVYIIDLGHGSSYSGEYSSYSHSLPAN